MAAPMKTSILLVLRIRPLHCLYIPKRVLSNHILTTCTDNHVTSHRLGYLSRIGNQGLRYKKHFQSNVSSSLSLTTLNAYAVQLRSLSTGLTDDMLRKEMDKLSDRFMEAKELLDDARESMGSVYFNDDLEDADKAVEETLTEYKSLLSQLSDEQKQNVMRTIGLRMEELGAQQQMIRESLKD